MRKWSLVLFCLTALTGSVLLLGCEGDTGATGSQGVKGRRGTAGYDPDRLPPADRPFAFGVTNKTENGVSGRKQIYLTFDSTARGTKDTVVVNRVSVPPLIDGKDDEEFEWGPQKSKISNMVKLDTNTSVLDYGLSRATLRAAYDDENFYMMFQWTETQFTAKNSTDTVEVTASESNEPDPLRFNALGFDGVSGDTVSYYTAKACSLKTKPDTIWTSKRVTYRDSCTAFIGGQCFCYRTIPNRDTGWVWQRRSEGEDRLVVFFPDTPTQGWQDAAFDQFFDFAGGSQTIPDDLLIDVWAWGAATTRPVGTADDWSLSASGKTPDIGQGPYIFNYAMPDSAPIYMSRRDPNIRTDQGTKALNPIYPLWFFDAVGFVQSGWDREHACYAPGIVTMIPSESRADIYAAATFDNGVWTVEMKRARNTHRGDDVQF